MIHDSCSCHSKRKPSQLAGDFIGPPAPSADNDFFVWLATQDAATRGEFYAAQAANPGDFVADPRAKTGADWHLIGLAIIGALVLLQTIDTGKRNR